MTESNKLVELCTVGTEVEGQIICDLLNSGGVPAMLHSGQLGGYGLISTSGHGGWGEVLVFRGNLEEAQELITLWQTPLLAEESSEEPAK